MQIVQSINYTKDIDVSQTNFWDTIFTNLSLEEPILLISFTQFLDKFYSFRISKQSLQLWERFSISSEELMWSLPVHVRRFVFVL